MKVLVIYRPNSEFARVTEEFIREYQHRHPIDELEIVDADSRDGSAAAVLYGIMQYPAILALRNDGSVLHSWEGQTLPLMDEIAYYTYSGS